MFPQMRTICWKPYPAWAAKHTNFQFRIILRIWVKIREMRCCMFFFGFNAYLTDDDLRKLFSMWTIQNVGHSLREMRCYVNHILVFDEKNLDRSGSEKRQLQPRHSTTRGQPFCSVLCYHFSSLLKTTRPPASSCTTTHHSPASLTICMIANVFSATVTAQLFSQTQRTRDQTVAQSFLWLMMSIASPCWDAHCQFCLFVCVCEQQTALFGNSARATSSLSHTHTQTDTTHAHQVFSSNPPPPHYHIGSRTISWIRSFRHPSMGFPLHPHPPLITTKLVPTGKTWRCDSVGVDKESSIVQSTFFGAEHIFTTFGSRTHNQCPFRANWPQLKIPN